VYEGDPLTGDKPKWQKELYILGRELISLHDLSNVVIVKSILETVAEKVTLDVRTVWCSK